MCVSVSVSVSVCVRPRQDDMAQSGARSFLNHCYHFRPIEVCGCVGRYAAVAS